MGIRAKSTQSIVNCFPFWSDIRTDEQSLGYQLINSIGGLHLDQIRKHLFRIEDNYYLPTAVISDPDVFYSAQLPQSFVFTSSDTDSTEMFYETPTVSGLLNETYHSVTLADNNDINGFWFDAVPSRFTTEDNTALSDLIASGYIIRTPFTPLTASGLTHNPTHLSITMSGGEYYVDTANGRTTTGLVQVDGITRAGIYLTEEVTFLYDDTIETFHEFTSVSGIRVYGIHDPETTFLWVKSSRFNDTFKPQSYDLETDLRNHEQKTYLGLNTTTNLNLRTLSLFTFDLNGLEFRLAGFNARSSVLDIELLDTNGTTIVPVDFIAEPHSNRIWVIANNYLYCYSSDIPYSNLTLLSEKDYDSPCRIEPSSYYITRGEVVTLDYVWRNQIKGLIKHRVWAQLPDGNKFSIIDGSMVTFTSGADSWVWGEPYNKIIRASDSFTLSQLGDYVFCLECYYADDTSSIDKRVITVPSKTALAEFDLAALGVSAATGIDIDSEYFIWILDTSGTKYKLSPHYDLMLIDYGAKILYFREPYTLVKVFDD